MCDENLNMAISPPLFSVQCYVYSVWDRPLH